MNRWKTNDNGIISKGTTDGTKEEFKDSLKKGVEIIEFEKE